MAKRSSYHIVSQKDGWAVITSGVNNQVRSVSRFETQGEAIEAGRRLAADKGGNLIVHRRDGEVKSLESFGRKVYLPKGVSQTRRALIKRAVAKTVGKLPTTSERTSQTGNGTA